MKEYYDWGGDTISNALIIFEVREKLDWKLGVYNGTEEQSEIDNRYENSNYSLMKTMFSHWKENSCKIAFICETDEVWFENNYDEFLDYVDIHINLDNLTSFAYSTAKEIMSRPHENATVILDNVMSQDWFFVDLFAPYLAFIENGEDENNGYYPVNCVKPDEILSKLHINAYFYTGTGFTDIFGNSVSLGDVNLSCYEAPYTYIIGEVSNQNDIYLENLRRESAESMFFAYNLYQSSVERKDDVMYGGISKNSIDYHLEVILLDFILNEDNSLLKYNNWSGRCMISFKIIYGKGGWLRRPKAYTLPPDPEDAN